MNNNMIFGLGIILIAVIVIAVVAGMKDETHTTTMKLTSSAFTDGAAIPATYTCEGAAITPPLSFSGVPSGTGSLALIVEDPDAVRGTFVHAVLYGISPTTTELAEDSLPKGSMDGTNSAGKTGYVPPCPPSGTHRYIFTLYALDTGFQGPPTGSVDAAGLRAAMQGHVIAYATLMGTYQKEQ